MAVTSSDSWYSGLLGLANGFLTSKPPKIKECLQCLQAVFQFHPSPAIQARTHLQIGRLLVKYTKNSDLARSHLEKAILLSQTLGPGFEEINFEGASLLSQIYKDQAQYPLAKQVLRQALEVKRGDKVYYWQFRLFFQLAEICACDKETKASIEVLEMGEMMAEQCGSQYMRCLFSLSEALILFVEKDFTHGVAVLSSTGIFLDRWQVQSYERESLVVFYLFLKVWHHLSVGQAKTVKPYLKQLQQSIQKLTTMSFDESMLNDVEKFLWLPREYLCVLVYLVTVMHSMYAGYMDKVLKYSAKALNQIDRLKVTAPSSLVSLFQMMLIEHNVLCRIVQGQTPHAIKEISILYQCLKNEPTLVPKQKPILHTLLGLYAMSMNLMEQATLQFNTAMKLGARPELASFISLNLAIIYIRAGESRQHELAALAQRIHPSNLPTNSHSLQAGYYYMSGLRAFFESRIQDAKKYLRETLKVSNAEDLNRLTACSLVLLGHTFLASGNPQEALTMVQPAMQLSAKIPDNYVQLWAASLLRDVFNMLGNPVQASESFRRHHTVTKQLIENHMQARKLQEHSLTEWVGVVSPTKVRTETPSISSQLQPDANLFLANFSQAGPSGMM
ncbi:MAU2 chromatid cohesion factor homolog [Exaiptasia diaphana]|uniref:MAU2 chromatid cohesion factor homolog n=1 Tax=Exaiptasia diaphana TaxID=2652724 RepID=A0A913Y4L8_EXADI|nr:MAU2 chromatid cohesion factor homolog [Exaiptasia diaphana]KXJ22726.1 MAU2 chromatid cohesion factor-like [Exaiptasia diaphana]